MPSRMKKKAIYTAIFGGYDNLKTPQFINKEFDYICFTDSRKLKSDIWKIVYIKKEEGLTSRQQARKIKILCHEYLPEYQLTIWTDGSITQMSDMIPFLSYCFYNFADMATILHPQSECLYRESLINRANGNSNFDISLQQEAHYRSLKVPSGLPVIASGILVRKHNKVIKKMMADWWRELIGFTDRDQVSFSYIAWKYPNAKITMLDYESVYKSFFKHTSHIRG